MCEGIEESASNRVPRFCMAVRKVRIWRINYQLMSSDAKLGEFLLNEIIATGNFGFHDSRYDDSKSFMEKSE